MASRMFSDGVASTFLSQAAWLDKTAPQARDATPIPGIKSDSGTIDYDLTAMIPLRTRDPARSTIGRVTLHQTRPQRVGSLVEQNQAQSGDKERAPTHDVLNLNVAPPTQRSPRGVSEYLDRVEARGSSTVHPMPSESIVVPPQSDKGGRTASESLFALASPGRLVYEMGLATARSAEGGIDAATASPLRDDRLSHPDDGITSDGRKSSGSGYEVEVATSAFHGASGSASANLEGDLPNISHSTRTVRGHDRTAARATRGDAERVYGTVATRSGVSLPVPSRGFIGDTSSRARHDEVAENAATAAVAADAAVRSAAAQEDAEERRRLQLREQAQAALELAERLMATESANFEGGDAVTSHARAVSNLRASPPLRYRGEASSSATGTSEAVQPSWRVTAGSTTGHGGGGGTPPPPAAPAPQSFLLTPPTAAAYSATSISESPGGHHPLATHTPGSTLPAQYVESEKTSTGGEPPSSNGNEAGSTHVTLRRPRAASAPDVPPELLDRYLGRLAAVEATTEKALRAFMGGVSAVARGGDGGGRGVSNTSPDAADPVHHGGPPKDVDASSAREAIAIEENGVREEEVPLTSIAVVSSIATHAAAAAVQPETSDRVLSGVERRFQEWRAKQQSATSGEALGGGGGGGGDKQPQLLQLDGRHTSANEPIIDSLPPLPTPSSAFALGEATADVARRIGIRVPPPLHSAGVSTGGVAAAASGAPYPVQSRLLVRKPPPPPVVPVRASLSATASRDSVLSAAAVSSAGPSSGAEILAETGTSVSEGVASDAPSSPVTYASRPHSLISGGQFDADRGASSSSPGALPFSPSLLIASFTEVPAPPPRRMGSAPTGDGTGDNFGQEKPRAHQAPTPLPPAQTSFKHQMAATPAETSDAPDDHRHAQELVRMQRASHASNTTPAARRNTHSTGDFNGLQSNGFDGSTPPDTETAMHAIAVADSVLTLANRALEAADAARLAGADAEATAEVRVMRRILAALPGGEEAVAAAVAAAGAGATSHVGGGGSDNGSGLATALASALFRAVSTSADDSSPLGLSLGMGSRASRLELDAVPPNVTSYAAAAAAARAHGGAQFVGATPHRALPGSELVAVPVPASAATATSATPSVRQVDHLQHQHATGDTTGAQWRIRTRTPARDSSAPPPPRGVRRIPVAGGSAPPPPLLPSLPAMTSPDEATGIPLPPQPPRSPPVPSTRADAARGVTSDGVDRDDDVPSQPTMTDNVRRDGPQLSDARNDASLRLVEAGAAATAHPPPQPAQPEPRIGQPAPAPSIPGTHEKPGRHARGGVVAQSPSGRAGAVPLADTAAYRSAAGSISAGVASVAMRRALAEAAVMNEPLRATAVEATPAGPAGSATFGARTGHAAPAFAPFFNSARVDGAVDASSSLASVLNPQSSLRAALVGILSPTLSGAPLGSFRTMLTPRNRGGVIHVGSSLFDSTRLPAATMSGASAAMFTPGYTHSFTPGRRTAGGGPTGADTAASNVRGGSSAAFSPYNENTA